MLSDIQIPGEVRTEKELKPLLDRPRKLTYEDFDFEKLTVYAGLDCIATSGVLAKIFPTVVQEEDIRIWDGEEKTVTAIS